MLVLRLTDKAFILKSYPLEYTVLQYLVQPGCQLYYQCLKQTMCEVVKINKTVARNNCTRYLLHSYCNGSVVGMVTLILIFSIVRIA
jgi:hypothetical protein